ncbi:MAG: hypothetical protein LKF37_10240 [Lentilactobacillus diolivorans]|jgi:hypothetical protein|nr:hypothetical protein [Lentilactobacillus diolivorans]
MTRFKDHQEAVKTLNEIDNDKSNYLIIHYSCESFFDTNGRTPHIAAIAVKKFNDAQAELFAIHKNAEIDHISSDKIPENYDVLEKKMLEEFFEYVHSNNEKCWIHWNMRDSNFGFKAIEQRYRVLGGTPEVLNDSKKLDLSRLFIKLYGKSYIENPRIPSLMKFNDIKQLNFLNGKEEAEAFKNREYVKLGFSTAGKVDVFSNFLTQAIDRKLKIKSKRSDIYGNRIDGWYAYMTSSTLGKALFWVFTAVISAIIGAVITHVI